MCRFENRCLKMEQLIGYFTTKQLMQKGLTTYKIRSLCAEDVLLKIKKGLYRNTEMFYQDQSFLDVCQAIPKAVVTSYSALSYYGLTTFIPQEVFICIPQNRKITKIDYPPTVQYRRDVTQFKEHIVTERRGKYSFHIYDMEKVVCDTIKNRKTMGMDTVKEVLQEYLKHKDNNMLKLYETAKKCKVFDVLDEFLTVMR